MKLYPFLCAIHKQQQQQQQQQCYIHAYFHSEIVSNKTEFLMHVEPKKSSKIRGRNSIVFPSYEY